MSATDGLLGSTEATGLVADDLRTLEQLARAANEPSPKFLVTMRIDRPNDTDAMAAFNRWKDLVLACTPERILSMVEGARRLTEESERQFVRADRNYHGWYATAEIARGLEAVIDDALTAMREPMTLADARRARDLLTHASVERAKANAEARAARAVPSSLEGDAEPV